MTQITFVSPLLNWIRGLDRLSQSVAKQKMDGSDLAPPCGVQGIDSVVVVASEQTTYWVNKSGCLGRQEWQLRRGLIVRHFYLVKYKHSR